MKDKSNNSFAYDVNQIIDERCTKPLISDDEISLVSPLGLNVYVVCELYWTVLNIMLNSTKEIIGSISFNYHNPGYSHYGNIAYRIDEKYQNKHYATKALGLLKKILVNHTYSGDKDIYISTFDNNVKSQKVACNNGGILVYDGDVPDASILKLINSTNKIKVYKISIDNKKSK